ncbi:MAG: hypothetical protein H0U87_09875, partial [Acidobacteria bacterium]|nr:hypothetical protein [Acidobacteriota bacterium]
MKKTTTKIKAAKFKKDAKIYESAFLNLQRYGVRFFAALLLTAIVSLFGFACESPSLKKVNSSTNSTQTNAPESTAAKSSLEDDLQTMRNANFDFIYVFRRRDGGALDGEDKRYLKAYAPAATNRFVLTDENKAVIAGSSYRFEQENLDNLQKRFIIEN